MKKKELEFIDSWFYSDLDIQLKASKSGQRVLVILESNAYYYNNRRYKGDKRRIICDSDDKSRRLYDFIKGNWESMFYGDYTKEQILNWLTELEANGIKLTVL